MSRRLQTFLRDEEPTDLSKEHFEDMILQAVKVKDKMLQMRNGLLYKVDQATGTKEERWRIVVTAKRRHSICPTLQSQELILEENAELRDWLETFGGLHSART